MSAYRRCPLEKVGLQSESGGFKVYTIQYDIFAAEKCMNPRQVGCRMFQVCKALECFFFFCILVDGHDSHEDAAACLELMRWKVKEDMKKTTRHRPPRHSL